MTVWDDRFTEHSAVRLIPEINNQLAIIENRINDDADAVAGHARLVRIVAEVDRRLQSLDPELVSNATLEGIAKHLQALFQSLQSLTGGAAPTEIGTANTHAENALASSQMLPVITTAADVESVQQAAVAFRRSLGQHAHYVEQEAQRTKEALDEVATQADKLESRINEQVARLDQAIQSTQQQVTAAEATRSKQLDDALTTVRQQLDQAAQQTRDAEDKRQRDFLDRMKALEAQWDDWQSEIAERETGAQQERLAAAGQRIAALDDFKARADKLVGIIAQTGMVGGYQQQANNEKRARMLFQGLTLAALFAFAWVMTIGLPITPDTEIDAWAEFGRRAIVSLAFAAMAAFCSREASRHSDRERRYRKAELEIASLGPFLSEFDKTERDGIMKEFADRVFGRDVVSTTHRDSVSTNGLLDTLNMVIKELFRRVPAR